MQFAQQKSDGIGSWIIIICQLLSYNFCIGEEVSRCHINCLVGGKILLSIEALNYIQKFRS